MPSAGTLIQCVRRIGHGCGLCGIHKGYAPRRRAVTATLRRCFMYDRRVRLPDLLVSEGIVHAETVVEIFEAQALYGGSFDTNLLELGILDEARLLPYLERVYGVSNRVDV